MIKQIKEKVLSGGQITMQEAEYLYFSTDKQELFAAAEEITAKMVGKVFEMCSIINAKSGKCSEDCKWCAQSAHYNGKCDIYSLLDYDEILSCAKMNERQGVKRYSLVCSGKRLSNQDVDKMCQMVRDLKKDTSLQICASLGLMGKEALQKLHDAGVSRYHCNLEAAPSYFPSLCTTHTIDEKLQTLRWAREVGFELCSGGIIGMGETPRQRVELALKLREVKPDSIPINILVPIKGTPLADTPPISDEEILTMVAIFRFLHPKAELRFAGGRARLSREVQLRALQIGINAAVVGDLLTTVGSKIDEDRQLVAEAGYQ